VLVAAGVGLAPIGAAGFVASAAGNSTGLRQTTTQVVVQEGEYFIKVSRDTVPSGTVVFTVTNTGRLMHDFSIRGESTGPLAPGQTATLSVDLLFGTYYYSSSLDDDLNNGMLGTIEVTSPPQTTTTTTTTVATTTTVTT